MKAHLDIAHTGTLGAEDRTRMTIDENSVAHLMGILTDLYSDRELAVIREYSTNAADSHRAAGITDPIEVTTPTSLFPTFTVKDHGLGLSVDEVLTQFSKYGFSSKRDTDDEVGMLGLGCKSALTYTSQFTLIVTKNGEQAMILVTREADGAGSVQVIATESTDEPNGVEVQVPVSVPHTFTQKVHQFFNYWERGTVLVDGKEPLPIWENPDAFVIDPDVVIVKGHGEDKVVMGGVAYPIPRHDYAHSIMPSRRGYVSGHAIVRVPIGSVNFVPSREALQFTKRTKEVIKTAARFVLEATTRIAQKEIDAQPTYSDAIRKAEEWENIWPIRADYKYRGRDVPQSGWEYTYGKHRDNISSWNIAYQVDSPASRTNWINVREGLEALHVVGYKGTGMSAALKRKLKRYAEDNPTAPKRVFLYPDKSFLGPWSDGMTIVDYETVIKPIDVGEEKVKSTGPAFRIVTGGDSWKAADTIENEGADVVLLEANSVFVQRNIAHDLARANGKAVLLVLKTQIKRYEQDLPKAVWFKDWLPKITQEFLSNLTEFECLQVHMWETLDDTHPLRDMLEPFMIKKPQRTYSRITGKYNEAGDPLEMILDPEVHWLVKSLRAADGSILNSWRLYVDANKEYGQPRPKLPIDVKALEKRIRAVLNAYPLFALHAPNAYRPRYEVTTQQFIQYLNDTYTLRTTY